jgi:murein DD-endopeptidase MepM/ murein hydrolase activator NlpD
MEYSDEYPYGYLDETIDFEEVADTGYNPPLPGIDVLAVVAVLLVAFMSYKVLRDWSGDKDSFQIMVPIVAQAEAPQSPAEIPDYSEIAAPYDFFTLTQGIHGADYGQMAIDISAGNKMPIKSPIHGEVSAYYVDEFGNPTLVIENPIYQVTLLHGVYSVTAGELVQLGQQIGTESNLGYTVDMQGVPCWGRDCGYHTHLNIFDKRIGVNVDPWALIGEN